jgi:4-amino-4-deoxy-L-arabinose transferase-like glycosyltransferase
MSWIIPGYLVHLLLPALQARYVLHLTLYFAAVFSFFYTLRILTNRSTALVASIVFGFYPYLWIAIGHDYVDGPGIAFYLASTALLTCGAKAKTPRYSLVFAGAAASAAFYSNVVWVLFFPFLGLYYLTLRRTFVRLRFWADLGRLSALCAAGAVLVTLALGGINYSVDGNFWFYRPSLNFAMAHVRDATPFKSPDYSWVLKSPWLLSPALAIVVGAIGVAFRRRQGKCGLLLFANLLITVAVLVIWEIRGAAFLQYHFYASYLIPATFLLLGSQMCFLPDHLSRRTTWIVTGIALFLLNLSWAKSDQMPWNGQVWMQSVGGIFAVPLKVIANTDSRTAPFIVEKVALVGLATLCALCAIVVTFRLWGVVVALVGFCSLNAYMLLNEPQSSQKTPGGERSAYSRISRGLDSIERVRQGRKVRFWFDSDDKFGLDFLALNANYLWDYTSIGRRFPSIESKVNVPIGSVVVIPSSRPEIVEAVTRSFTVADRKLAQISKVNLEAYDLFFFEAVHSGEWNPLHVAFDAQGVGHVLETGVGDGQADFSLDKWRLTDSPADKGIMQYGSSGLDITTLKYRWAYAAIYTPLIAPVDGRYNAVLEYQNISGNIVFGILNADQSAWLVQSDGSRRSGSNFVQECSVSLKAGERFFLLISNNQPTDGRSHFVIKGVKLFKLVE